MIEAHTEDDKKCDQKHGVPSVDKSETDLKLVKLGKTTKDRLLELNKLYSEKQYGIWIQCTLCSKWRSVMEYEEGHQVPRHWCCSMSDSISSGCDEPENVEDKSLLDFVPGSIVWARLRGYPWWPAMVEIDPDTEEYYRIAQNNSHHYNVTFLDEKVSRAWVPASCICSFLKPPSTRKDLDKKCMTIKFVHMRDAAERKAKAALTMSIKERLQKFSFAQLYTGTWPLAEDQDDDENVKDTTGKLIEDTKDAEPVQYSDSGDETESSEELMEKIEMDPIVNHMKPQIEHKNLTQKSNKRKNYRNEFDFKFCSDTDMDNSSKIKKKKLQVTKQF